MAHDGADAPWDIDRLEFLRCVCQRQQIPWMQAASPSAESRSYHKLVAR
jgi:hypothetical protein